MGFEPSSKTLHIGLIAAEHLPVGFSTPSVEKLWIILNLVLANSGSLVQDDE